MTTPPRQSAPMRLPAWGWITLAALTALILLPLYVRWFAWAAGNCPSAAILRWMLPRVA